MPQGRRSQLTMHKIHGVLLLALLVVLAALLSHSSSLVSRDPPRHRPNILLFLLDDLDVKMTGRLGLEKAYRWIADEGATFENAFTTSPVCCPSRASILTGQYPHNTGEGFGSET